MENGQLIYETGKVPLGKNDEISILGRLCRQNDKVELTIEWSSINSNYKESMSYKFPYKEEYNGKDGLEIYKDVVSGQRNNAPSVKLKDCNETSEF